MDNSSTANGACDSLIFRRLRSLDFLEMPILFRESHPYNPKRENNIMPTVVECPSCGKKLKVPDEYLGKKVRCSDCNGTFVSGKPPSKAPPKAPVRVEEDDVADDVNDDDEAPVRKRSRSSMEPHRGTLILILGIAGLAGTFIIGIIAIIPAILAWIWGKADLKKMDDGAMDPEGRSNTSLGKMLGMIGVIVNGIGLLIGCVLVILWLVIGVALFSAASKSMPPSVASTNAPQAAKSPEKAEKGPAKADAGTVDTNDFLKNTSAYKGQTITLTLLVAEEIKNKGSLKDYVGKDVKFAALTKNRQRLEIKITIPDGLDVPKAGFGDPVKVTFVCKDGSLQHGNEAKSIETASLR